MCHVWWRVTMYDWCSCMYCTTEFQNFKIHVYSRRMFSMQFPAHFKSNSLKGSTQWFSIVTSRYDPLGLECHSCLFPTTGFVVVHRYIFPCSFPKREEIAANFWSKHLGFKYGLENVHCSGFATTKVQPSFFFVGKVEKALPTPPQKKSYPKCLVEQIME